MKSIRKKKDNNDYQKDYSSNKKSNNFGFSQNCNLIKKNSMKNKYNIKNIKNLKRKNFQYSANNFESPLPES